MFGLYFGAYLKDKGIITEAQLKELLEEAKTARLRLGLIAVERGYMSEKEAEEVNSMQQKFDKRFGDIAVEMGYLTPFQVEEMLKNQGDAYLIFVQLLTDKKILTMEEIDKELSAYKRDMRFTDMDLEAVKSSDIDRIIQVFMKEPSIPPVIKDYIALASRNMIRLVDNHSSLSQVIRTDKYNANLISIQEIIGEYKIFTAFSGDEAALTTVAKSFAKEAFDADANDLDILDVLDANCELLNCNNGMFATKLSSEDVDIDLVPPQMYAETKSVQSDGNIFVVPFKVHGKDVDMVICLETTWAVR